MKSTRLHPVLAAALLLAPLPAMAATPPALQAEQSPTMPAPDGLGRGGKLGSLLTQEQRAMMLFEVRDQMKDMAPEQRQTFRKEQVQKILAMSPADRQKFQADLQAKWDALPQDQKDRIQQRLARQQSGQNTVQ
jgi:hypothetical protein